MPMCDGKKRYEDEKDAATAAAMWEGQRMESLYWYKCPVCSGYHLTKQARNNEAYFKEKKAEIINKYNKPSKNCYKAVEVTDFLNECKSLMEVVEWNNTHRGKEISLKKAARHFPYEYMVEWNKNYPAHVVNLEWHIKQHVMALDAKSDATILEILKWNKAHPGNPASLKRFLLRMTDEERMWWNLEHPDLTVPRVSKK